MFAIPDFISPVILALPESSTPDSCPERCSFAQGAFQQPPFPPHVRSLLDVADAQSLPKYSDASVTLFYQWKELLAKAFR
jgi:hypothetical protein